jgi:hypothetical protein
MAIAMKYEVGLHLTPRQQRKLLKNQAVVLKHHQLKGGDVIFKLDRKRANRLERNHKLGKGMKLQMTDDELQASGLWDWLKKAWTTVKKGVKEGVKKVAEVGTKVYEHLKTAAQRLEYMKRVVEFMIALPDKIAGILEGIAWFAAIVIFQNVLGIPVDKWKSELAKALNISSIKNMFSKVSAAIKRQADKVKTLIGMGEDQQEFAPVDDIVDFVKRFFSWALKTFWEAIKSIYEWPWTVFFGPVVNLIIRPILKTSWLFVSKQAGNDVITGEQVDKDFDTFFNVVKQVVLIIFWIMVFTCVALFCYEFMIAGAMTNAEVDMAFLMGELTEAQHTNYYWATEFRTVVMEVLDDVMPGQFGSHLNETILNQTVLKFFHASEDVFLGISTDLAGVGGWEWAWEAAKRYGPLLIGAVIEIFQHVKKLGRYYDDIKKSFGKYAKGIFDTTEIMMPDGKRKKWVNAYNPSTIKTPNRYNTAPYDQQQPGGVVDQASIPTPAPLGKGKKKGDSETLFLQEDKNMAKKHAPKKTTSTRGTPMHPALSAALLDQSGSGRRRRR